MGHCPGSPSGPFDAIVKIFELLFNPFCILKAIIAAIFNTVLAPFTGTIREWFIGMVINVPAPDPASGAIAWNASSTPWTTVYAINANFAVLGVTLVALGAAIGMALGAIRAIPARTKNKIYRRSIIGGLFVVFNRPFLALYLEFVNAMHQLLADFGTSGGIGSGAPGAMVVSTDACLKYYTFSAVLGMVPVLILLNVIGLAVIGAILIFFMMYMAVQFMIDVMIYGLFMFAPLFITGWAVAHGPLKPLGEKAEKGLTMFMSVALANWPALLLWKSACLLFGETSVVNTITPSGVPVPGGALLEGLLGLAFLLSGFYITIKSSIAGQKLMGAVGTAVKVAAVGATAGAGAAGLAAGGVNGRMAMKMGNIPGSVGKTMGFDSSGAMGSGGAGGGGGKDLPFSGPGGAAGYMAKSGANQMLGSTPNSERLQSAGGWLQSKGLGRTGSVFNKAGEKLSFGDEDGELGDFTVGDPEEDPSAEIDEASGEFVGNRSSEMDAEPGSIDDLDNAESAEDEDELDDDEVVAVLEDDQVEAVFDEQNAISEESGNPGEFMYGNEDQDGTVDAIEGLIDQLSDDIDEDEFTDQFAEERDGFEDYLDEEGKDLDDAGMDDVADFAEKNGQQAQLDAVKRNEGAAATKLRIQQEAKKDIGAIDRAASSLKDDDE